MKKFIITEEERKHIRDLYEQTSAIKGMAQDLGTGVSNMVTNTAKANVNAVKSQIKQNTPTSTPSIVKSNPPTSSPQLQPADMKVKAFKGTDLSGQQDYNFDIYTPRMINNKVVFSYRLLGTKSQLKSGSFTCGGKQITTQEEQPVLNITDASIAKFQAYCSAQDDYAQAGGQPQTTQIA